MSEETIDIKFRPKKRKPLRNRLETDSESDEESLKYKLEEMKTIQKLRERPKGIDIQNLNNIVKCEKESSKLDPFKLETGGIMDMAALKNKPNFVVDDAYDTGIGTQFSAETNKRDEDDDMMKYIEEQLTERKRGTTTNNIKTNKTTTQEYCSLEEAALQSIPDHLLSSSTMCSEEMLSNQMLNGIPEIDLGIETKIRNIEATEDAKFKLLWNKQNKKEAPSQFVPTNMAVNFVQHNRFNVEESGMSINEEKDQLLKKRGIQMRNKRKDAEQATDDYHYEKFKKQFRRY